MLLCAGLLGRGHASKKRLTLPSMPLSKVSCPVLSHNQRVLITLMLQLMVVGYFLFSEVCARSLPPQRERSLTKPILEMGKLKHSEKEAILLKSGP